MTLAHKSYRDTARSALHADDRFSDFEALRIWSKKINQSDLPAIGVGIPQWSEDRFETSSSGERVSTIVVVVKRSGSGLEDLGDGDAETIFQVLLEALDDDQHDLSLREASYQEDPDGELPVSTLSMAFTIKSWPANQ